MKTKLTKDIKLIEVVDDIKLFEQALDMIYQEWGNSFHSSKEEKIKRFTTNKNTNFLPKMYVMTKNDKVIGTFTIKENDLHGSNLSPWLACVVIRKDKRGKGYGTILLHYIHQTIEDLHIDKIYLTTLHIGFYEKIGFKYLQNVDKDGETNRLYVYENKTF